MARLLYKPFAIILSIVAGKIAAAAFRAVWGRLDKDSTDGTPPIPTEQNAPVRKAVAARVVEGATYAGTRAVVDRAGVRAFHYLTGVWVGPKPVKDKDKSKA